MSLNQIATPPIARSMADFGLELLMFQIEAVSIVDEDPRVQQVLDSYHRLMKEDMEERMRLKRRQEQLQTFTVERSFDVSQAAAESIGTAGTGGGGDGSGSGLLGTVLGLGMAMPLAGNLSGMVTQSMNPEKCTQCQAPMAPQSKFCGACGNGTQLPPPAPSSPAAPSIACDKCKATFDASCKFCPQCGDPYNPCPHCGADQAQDVSVCFDCNKPMSTGCISCGDPSAVGAKFCPNCGSSQTNPPS